VLSLRTRDPVEAKRRFAEALAQLEARWANLRAGPKTISWREAHQIAVFVHDRWLELHRDNPSQQTHWRIDLADRLFTPPAINQEGFVPGKISTNIDMDTFEILKLEKWCEEIADQRLAVCGLVVDDQGRHRLAVAVGAAVQRASLMLARLAKGEVLSSEPLFPARIPTAQAASQPLTFKFLVDGWVAERRPVAKTVYEWSRVVRQLEEYLGHNDARRLVVFRQVTLGVTGLKRWVENTDLLRTF